MPDKAKAPAGNDSIARSLHRDGSFAPRPRAALDGAGIFANGQRHEATSEARIA
jgi:hypothetical protein